MTPQTSTPSLEQLQHWLQAVIMHPGGVEGEMIEQVILPSSRQSSAERLAVYSSAYYLRLVDCLREFVPCLRFAMGDEVFDDFALAYLQQHPSQSYTLHHLADQFANFLSDTRPVGGDQQPGWEDFFVDLARLEHAIEVVFDAEGPEEPSPSGRGQGEGLTSQSNISFVPGFQLLAFRYPVSSFYTAWKRDQRPQLPSPGQQQIALFRRDYIVRRHELTSVQYELLTALQAGATLEESLARAAPLALASNESPDSLAVNLRDWFEHWTRERFFLPAEY